MTQEPQRFRDTIIFPASLDPDAVRVVTRLQDQGFESYLVGGCVRDLLAGRIPKDFDVSTAARPRQIRRVFRNSRIIGRRFKLAHVHFGTNIIEVATFRRTPDETPSDDAASSDTPADDAPPSSDASVEDTRDDASAVDEPTTDDDAADEASEEPREESRRGRDRDDGRGRRGGRRRRRRGDDAPDTAERDGLLIVRDNEFGNAEEDVIRRDFTINALLYDVKKEEVIDYVGGVQDLNDRVMRTIGDAPLRLAEDPVRMLRAVKFTSRLDLHLDDELDAAMRSCAHLIERSAAPRVLEEIYKFLTCGNAERALDMLVEYDLLTYLLPEIAPYWNAHRDELRALGAAIDMLDGGRRSLSNGFLLSALFCPIWRDALDEGSDPVAVARDVISPAAQRMSIPRKDVAEVKQLLATLLRLERNRRSRRVRIQEYLKRSSTRDAIQLLHLFARAGLSDPELHARWSYRLAALDPQPPASARKAARDESSDDDEQPRKKRRRRRGGRRSRSQRTNRERHEDAATNDESADAPTADAVETPKDAPSDAPKVTETPSEEAPVAETPDAVSASDAPRAPSGIKRLVRRLFHRVRGGDDSETSTTDTPPAAEAKDAETPEVESPASAETAADSNAPASTPEDTREGDGEARPRSKRRRRGGRRRRSGAKSEDKSGDNESSNESGEKADNGEPKSKSKQSKRRRSSSKKKTSSRGGRRDGDENGQRKAKKKRSTKSKSEKKESDNEYGQRHPEDVEDFFDW